MRHVSTLLLIAGTVALAACGGSDDNESDASETTTTTEVTRANYIAQADAFCKESNAIAKRLNERSQRAVEGKTTDKARLAALAPILTEGYPIQALKGKEFAAIPRPPADEPTLAKLLALNEQKTALVGQLADAASSRDVKRASAVIAKQQRVAARSEQISKSYGFKECGSGANEAG